MKNITSRELIFAGTNFRGFSLFLDKFLSFSKGFYKSFDKIGKNCMIGGQVAISGHLTIADEIKIAGQSGIASSITEKGAIVQGPMAFDIKEFQRSYIIFKQLPQMHKILNSIKKQFDV